VRRYNDGMRTAISYFLLIVALFVGNVFLVLHDSDRQSHNLSIRVDAFQIVAAAISMVTCLSLPRRPSVLERNHVVDDQYTASAISSYTFSFASKVLSLARSKRSLDLVDLPKLHLWARSSYLLENFTTVPSNKKPLWKSVIYTHYPEFIFQTSWAVMQSALQFAPQLAMYFLLKLLEQRAQGAPVENAAWGLVVALGASIVLASWTQAWEHWICWARLGQLIRAELSAMIFSKSLRRKDVKGVAKAKVTNEPDPNSTAVATNDPGGEGPSDPLFEESMEAEQPGMKSAPDGDDDEDNQKSRQSTINLVVSIYVCILHLFR